MSKRAYGQYCGLVRAVEMIGERWALPIVRDLLVEPKRYTDLRNGLPRIPTNILSSRLKELEATGVVQRRILPRPDGSVVYELTEYGHELEDVVLGLARWGARSLGEPREDEIVTAASLIMALRATYHAETAAGLSASYELHIDPDIVLHVVFIDGAVEIAEGAHPVPDLVIAPVGQAMKQLMAGELTPQAALGNGSIRISGDPALLSEFADIFRIADREPSVEPVVRWSHA